MSQSTFSQLSIQVSKNILKQQNKNCFLVLQVTHCGHLLMGIEQDGRSLATLTVTHQPDSTGNSTHWLCTSLWFLLPFSLRNNNHKQYLAIKSHANEI